MKFALFFFLVAGFLASLGAQDGKTGAGEKKEELPNFGFAFVCVAEEKMPDPAKVEKAFRSVFSLKKDTPLEVKVEESEEEEDREQPSHSISVSFSEKDFIIASSAGFPVPWEDMEYACMNSVFWPQAETVMKKSKSHYIVFVQSPKEDPKERALHLSRTLSAIAQSTDALGIYYGTADIVHEPKAYQDLISDPIEAAADVPATVWVGFLFQGHESGCTSLYTRGLESFGCKEVEVVESKKKPSELFELVFGLSQYLIFEGDVIEDGHTVGGTEEEKITVHLKKSQLDREKVLRVDF